MAGRASAFAVLGLEAGADSAAVEQAYKRLIKKHHPDRAGGDSSRAAEITKAYRELRGGKAAEDPLQFNEDIAGRKPRRLTLAAAIAVAAVAGLALVLGRSAPLSRTTAAAGTHLPVAHASGASVSSPEPMDEELHVGEIDGAVRDALQLFHTSDEMALANASRDCQLRFRHKPGTALLDRCAAFDDAVIGLQDRDPLRDQGPFAPLAVTGRQWSAASTLSDDYLAIDGRLDQIRLRVEMELAAQLPPIAPATGN
jgi:hypothetical protein